MRLPIAISVPHAGISCPTELAWYNALTAEDVYHDHDIGAAELFSFADRVTNYFWTPVARAYVDTDRPANDFGADGVFKVHTRWHRSVYRSPPPPELVEHLINTYHRNYHYSLSAAASQAAVGIDCRALIPNSSSTNQSGALAQAAAHIGFVDGSCPMEWVYSLHAELSQHLLGPVFVVRSPANAYTLQAHMNEMPWIRLEVQPHFGALGEQRDALVKALTAWCARLDGPSRERRNLSRWTKLQSGVAAVGGSSR